MPGPGMVDFPTADRSIIPPVIPVTASTTRQWTSPSAVEVQTNVHSTSAERRSRRRQRQQPSDTVVEIPITPVASGQHRDPRRQSTPIVGRNVHGRGRVRGHGDVTSFQQRRQQGPSQPSRRADREVHIPDHSHDARGHYRHHITAHTSFHHP